MFNGFKSSVFLNGIVAELVAADPFALPDILRITTGYDNHRQ